MVGGSVNNLSTKSDHAQAAYGGAVGVETPASNWKAVFTSGTTVRRASISLAVKAGAKCITPLTVSTSRKRSSAGVGTNSDI
jgi:hypothetical protein